MDKLEKDDLHFDELKNLWQNSLESDAAKNPIFNNAEILTIMQKKVSSAVQKIRRNLLIEVLTTIPIVIGTYFLFEARGLHLPIVFWVGTILITFGYHVYLYWKLQNKVVPTTTVLETIQKQRTELRGFIKMYDYAAVLGGIIFCAASGLTFYTHFKQDVLMYVVLILLSLSSGYGFYAGCHWYVQKLYGKHYSTLEASEKVLVQI